MPKRLKFEIGHFGFFVGAAFLNLKNIDGMMKLIQLSGVFVATGCTCANKLGLAVVALVVAFAAVLFEEYEKGHKETKN